MSNRLEDDWKNTENGGRTPQKERPFKNGDSDLSGNQPVANPKSNQSNIHLTITLKDGSTSFTPVITGTHINGDVNLSQHVQTGKRNADAASSPQAKEPQADSAGYAGRSEDQRDEDMEVSD